MHARASTACAVVSTMLVVAYGMRPDGLGGQDSIFSEAQAYERFMGRWSRRLAPLVVGFAGVQDGDTLRFVNGQRIDSVQSAFQLYNILKESTNVEITVLRNTRPVTLRYVIY